MDRQTQLDTPRELRSTREIGLMRRAGLVVWQAHQAAAALLRPGVTTAELDAAVARVFIENEARPLFLNYPGPGGPFPAVTCISVNEEIVHGIPGPRQLQAGDIVSIDTGCRVRGWCGDAAVTHAIGQIPESTQQLLTTTRETLDLAIDLLCRESSWRPISQRMAAHVRRQNFSVVENLVGHGIGKNLHEPPQVPNFYDPDSPSEDFEIRPGLVIAIEPMINAGTKNNRLLSDQWTVVTADGRPSAHFEHTVAVTADGVRRLTAAPQPDELELVAPQFRDPASWVVW